MNFYYQVIFLLSDGKFDANYKKTLPETSPYTLKHENDRSQYNTYQHFNISCNKL